MTCRAPFADQNFILNHVVAFSAVMNTERYNFVTDDVITDVLGAAARLCDDVVAPTNRAGDRHPARLEAGQIKSAPGFAEAYQAIADGGWVGVAADPEFGGMGLPYTLASCVNEMLAGANLSLQLKPLLSQGQIEALSHHASPELKALFLPKLISGQWSGTMDLTEPQAGSDVGALRTTAVANEDGSYCITGQKIFITWGDSDLVENVCHLVLARRPGAPDGTRGISLFLVPKFLPDADGNPGEANKLHAVSLEHKLGIHGSPTCVMAFEGAKGWLVGAPEKGMAAMFTMMNNARLGVGLQGVGVAEAALQKAVNYAVERVQGATASGETGIIGHADMRRMLAEARAVVFAARSIGLACAKSIDMANATQDPHWIARAALLTPIAKFYGTEVGMSVADIGVQVHGGMGFIEETGAAQYLRDARITAIYEGTNGIQAMDLVGRKLGDGGEAAFRMIQEVQTTSAEVRGLIPELAGEVWQAAENLRETTEILLTMEAKDRCAGAVPYMRAFALVLAGHAHIKAALADPARHALAGVMIHRLLPAHAAHCAIAREGAAELYALGAKDLML